MSAIASKSVQTPTREAAPSAVRSRPGLRRAQQGRVGAMVTAFVERGREAWAVDELHWGIWDIPESELRLVDGLEAGADVIELGCGTAAICAWLARRGFSPMGVDIARPLLETAAEFEREFGVAFPLLCANAEHLHFEDASFDCAISEYGASLWCDPQRWVAEAARLLRPNGLLVFVTSGAHLISCTPDGGGLAGDCLVRDYFSRYRIEFEGPMPSSSTSTMGTGYGSADERLRDRGPPAQAARRGDSALSVRVRGLGAALAERGNLGRSKKAPTVLL